MSPGKALDGDLVGRNLLLLDMSHSRHINAPRFSTRMQEMLQPARGWAKTTISALGDEFIRPEQVLGPVPTFPLDLIADDVNMEMDSYRITPRSIVNHRVLQGFSGAVSVQYLTSWNELEKTS